MKRTQRTYKFKKGEALSLDQIYDIQGFGGGDWWERTGEDLPSYAKEHDIDLSETLICTRDIKIIVIVESA